jgi:lipid-A-disaccharide synthase
MTALFSWQMATTPSTAGSSLYIVVGERSGDRHGAGLIQSLHQLNPSIQIHGLGGPQMRILAPNIDDWVEEAAVVGLVEVLRKYRFFKKRFAETLAQILSTQPTAVVLIDYPGFNLRLAEALRKAKFTGKILYYISPQVWAWHRSRIPKMAKWLDLMLCIFPFEKDLYLGYGLNTEFTGHPLVAWHRAQDAGQIRQTKLVGLFPGSRRREITKVFTPMLEAAKIMHLADPELKFKASAASEKLAVLMREQLTAFPRLEIDIEVGTVYQLMRTCTVGVVASGTATLEAAILGLPYVLVYKVAWPTYLVGKQLIKVPFLGMVNILAGKQIIPELIQSACEGKKIATNLLELLSNPDSRHSQLQQAAEVITGLGDQDAYAKAAKSVKSMLGERD